MMTPLASSLRCKSQMSLGNLYYVLANKIFDDGSFKALFVLIRNKIHETFGKSNSSFERSAKYSEASLPILLFIFLENDPKGSRIPVNNVEASINGQTASTFIIKYKRKGGTFREAVIDG